MKLTKRVVDAASAKPKRYWLWDDQVRGFGCRVTPSGRRSYYVKYRTLSGTQRRLKLGDHGVLPLKRAREQATALLAAARRGEDPAHERKQGRVAPTVAELGARFLQEHARPHKKPSSVAMDESNLANHLIPRLGTRKVAEVTHSEVVGFHQAIGKKAPGAANRVLALLSKMMNLAEKWGLRDPGSNPCRHVVKFKEKKVERYVSPEEYVRLEQVISENEASGKLAPVGALALRLLMHSGCRLGEVLGLQHRDVNFVAGELILRDAKAGGRRVPLGENALAYLGAWVERSPPRTPETWLLPRPGRACTPICSGWMWGRWRWLRRDAQLPDLRVHDLRHGFASVGAEQGLSLLQIGALLGHKTPATTARYAHLVNEPLRRAAQTVSGAITDRLLSAPPKRNC